MDKRQIEQKAINIKKMEMIEIEMNLLRNRSKVDQMVLMMKMMKSGDEILKVDKKR